MTDQESGREAVPVSRFRARESDKELPINDISGPLFSSLSLSARLQSSLESKLRAKVDVNGSPEYELIWSQWDMPAGPLISRLRASVRRTLDKDCSGWVTPTQRDYKDGACSLETNAVNGRLGVQVRTPAGWATPNAGPQNINDATWRERREKMRAKYRNGNGFGLTLGQMVNSFFAAMIKHGALNPAFSRWLLGFPETWDEYAPTETQ